MAQFIRPIDKLVEDLLVPDIETLCHLSDELYHHIPDFLCDSELNAVSCRVLKQTADGLIVGEPPCRRKQVVQHGGYRSHGNLRGEVAHLVLAESESPLAVLEYDLQRPPHGINLIGIEEVELTVGGDESVPFSPLATLAEEEAYVPVCKLHVHCDVVADKHTTVFATLLELVEECHELDSSILLTLIHVFGGAHLNHTEIVALYMPGSDKIDDLSAYEPTVSQNVVKVYLIFDDTPYHLYYKRNFALVILLYALGCVRLIGVLLGGPCFKLLLLQAVFLFLAFLSDKREVKQHLASTVSDAKEESLEAKFHRVCHVGEHLSYKFSLKTTFREVCFINHQTDRNCLLTGTVLLYLTPKLHGNYGENLAPVMGLLRKKPIERVTLQENTPNKEDDA